VGVVADVADAAVDSDAAAFAAAVDSDAADLDVADLDAVDLDAVDLDAVDLDAVVVSALVVSDLGSVLYKKNVPLLVLPRGIPIFSAKVNVPSSTLSV
jgi:hypothetical protein